MGLGLKKQLKCFNWVETTPDGCQLQNQEGVLLSDWHYLQVSYSFRLKHVNNLKDIYTNDWYEIPLHGFIFSMTDESSQADIHTIMLCP